MEKDSMPAYLNGELESGSGGGTGSRGPRGLAADSLRWIYLASGTVPATPTGGARTGRELTTLPSGGWALNPPSTLAANQRTYAVLVTLSGSDISAVPVYSAPGVWSGPGSPRRVFIYRKTTATLSARPTGGSYDANGNFTLPANWLAQPPGTVALGESVYAVEVVLTEGVATPTYSLPMPWATLPLLQYSATGTSNWHGEPATGDMYFRWKLLGTWSTAQQFREDGEDGDDGHLLQVLYQRTSGSLPPAPPTGGTVANGIYTPAGGSAWETSEPSGSNALYIVFVIVNPNDSTFAFSEVLRVGAVDGSSRTYIYLAAATAPPTPTGGSQTDGVLTPPSGGWGINPVAPAAGQPVYVVAVTLPPGDGTPTYSAPVIFSAIPEFQFSTDGTTWVTAQTAETTYVRWRVGNLAWTTGVKFIGTDGADSFAIQYSADNSNWHTTLDDDNDKYIRFRIGTSAWSDGKKFVGDDGDDADIQFSTDGTAWHDTFDAANDTWVRFRVGTGAWSDGKEFVGADGDDADINYSADNSAWHSAFNAAADIYIRFRIGTGSWTEGKRFVGIDGTDGEDATGTDTIFIAATALPATPTGGAITNGALSTLPSGGWTSSPPTSLTPAQRIYASKVTLPYSGSPTYTAPVLWNGAPGDASVPVYKRAAALPTELPTGGFAAGVFTHPTDAARWIHYREEAASLTVPSSIESLEDITTDGTNLYWLDSRDDDTQVQGRVYQTTLTGASPTMWNIPNPASWHPRGITYIAAAGAQPAHLLISFDSQQRLYAFTLAGAGSTANDVNITSHIGGYLASTATEIYRVKRESGTTTFSAFTKSTAAQSGDDATLAIPRDIAGIAQLDGDIHVLDVAGYVHVFSNRGVAKPEKRYQLLSAGSGYNGLTFNEDDAYTAALANTVLTGYRAEPALGNLYQSNAEIDYAEGAVAYTLFFLISEQESHLAPTPGSYATGISYGLANASNVVQGTAANTAAFTLRVGQSHTTALIHLPVTTAVGVKWYVTLPAGLTLTAAVDSVNGNVLYAWTRVGTTQTWVYNVGFDGSTTDMTFTVRRDT